MAKQGPLSGQQVANKYRLGELLGSGGMGAVYKAQDIQLHRPVAVKVMRPANPVSALELQDYTQRFQEEALRLANLKHQGIPHIYEYFEEAGRWFLVMEFIEGNTLKEYLERCGGLLPVDEVLTIGFQLADVLNYLHTPLPNKPPIIFRDLKPANVMIAPDSQVFLIDFGIARLFTPGKRQDTFVALSPGYAAPEQHGTAQTTVRSDIYSLGATMHHLLSGTHPATSPFLFAPLSIQHPPQLAMLIAHMVEIDAARRPASMAVVKDALQRMRDQTAAAGLSTNTVLAPTPPVPLAFLPATQPAQPPKATIPLAGSSSGSPFPSLGRSTPSTIGTPARGTTLAIWRPHGGARALAWSPDGQRIASGASPTERIEIRDAITGKTLIEPSDFLFDASFSWHLGEYFNSDSSWAIEAIVWSPDGKYILTGNSERPHSQYPPSSVLFWQASGQGSRYARGKFWNRERWFGLTVEEILRGDGPLNAILWSPDVSKVAVVRQRQLTVFALMVPGLRGHEPVVHSSLQNRSRRGDMWSPINGDTGPWWSVNGDAVAWSPDSTRIAWGTQNEIPVWDVRSSQQGGHHLLTYRQHRSPIVVVSWSPDGRQITSRSADGSGQVWDAGSGQTLATFTAPVEGERYWVYLVDTTRERSAISPDGVLTAVATDDGVELRTVARGDTIFVYRGHFSDKTAQYWSPHVNALAWSPDGTRIAFARFDGTIYIWRAV